MPIGALAALQNPFEILPAGSIAAGTLLAPLRGVISSCGRAADRQSARCATVMYLNEKMAFVVNGNCQTLGAQFSTVCISHSLGTAKPLRVVSVSSATVWRS